MRTLVFVLAMFVCVKLFIPQLLTAASLNGALAWIPVVLLLALGEMLVIITGGIDISIGSTLGLTAVILGTVCMNNPQLTLPVLIALCAGCGFVLGCINWLLIDRAKLSPLIATVATMAAYRGLTFWLAQGKSINATQLPQNLLDFSSKGFNVGPINISWLLILSITVAAIVHFFLVKVAAGRNLYAYGNQPQAAFRRGIRISAVQLTTYGLCGLCAGLAGFAYTSKFAFVHASSAGAGNELTAIAAVVIGGTKLTGGVGSVPKVVLSCVFLSILDVALSVTGIGADWQMFFYGAVLLAALSVDRFNQKSTAARI
jgi:ribose/xylose/arabinose/galactoside ABC-type transport system permease subunit